MSGSALGVAVEALHATFSTGAPSDVDVIDGVPVDPGRKFLCVGWDESDQPAITWASEMGDYGMSQDNDTLQVSNLLSCFADQNTPASLRIETDAAFATLKTALRADPTLGGLALNARVTSGEYFPPYERPGQGVLAQIRFTVTVRIFA